MHDIWPQLRRWIASGEPFALATVVSARSPSPRGIGSVLAISRDGGRFLGSVSAGCVESEVIEMAVACMADGKTRWKAFGPSQGFPWEVAFSCGGKITVRVERFDCDQETVGALTQLFENHQKGVWIRGESHQALLLENGTLAGNGGAFSEEILREAREILKVEGQTREMDTAEEKVLLQLISQPHRLFIIGAGHISLNLVHLTKILNCQTLVIDPRESFAREERFETKPDHLWVEWPDTALQKVSLTACDSLVALTHDPKIDDQALEIALRHETAYIGALGSRRSHAARLKRLAALGVSPDQLERIHGPVGLDIGSSTPAEIAVSIAAEMIQVMHAPGVRRKLPVTHSF